MANMSSAEKRHKQSLVRRESNRACKSEIKTYTRSFYEILESGKTADAEAKLREVVKLIDTAAGKGIFHKKTAARKKSRLYKTLHKAS